MVQYGNQAELEVQYSRAAILIRIPPSRLRGNEYLATKTTIYDDVEGDVVDDAESGAESDSYY